MRRILYGLAIFLMGMGMATAQMPPPSGNVVMQPDVGAFVDGYLNIDQDGQIWNVHFWAATETDWNTGAQYSHFHYWFGTETQNGWINGNLACDVPNNSISASQSRGALNIRIPDPTVESCSGGIYGDGLPNQPWTQPVEITGYMTNPKLSVTEVVTRTETLTDIGSVQRYQCQRGDGFTADSGGFSLTLPSFDGFLYFPVGSDPEAYNVISGSFHFQNCRTITRTK